jgi:alpha-L-fucosidase 2
MFNCKGWKKTNPFVSPEAAYKNGTLGGAITIGVTCDKSIVWEVFTNIIEMSKALDNKDKTLVERVKKLRSQLRPLQISSSARGIRERIEDFVEDDPGHRHISHFYGLFPGCEITPENETPWEASEVSVKRRVE